MRIRQAYISDFKNVHALLNWARAVVLFGRNDAGKSNILEAIADSSGGGTRARQDPMIGAYEAPHVRYAVELDQLADESSQDAELLARLLQIRHVPPLFPYTYTDDAPPDPEIEQDRWGGQMVLNQFPASLLEWDLSNAEGHESQQFKLGTVGEMYSAMQPLNTIGTLAAVRAELTKRALDYAEDAFFLAQEHHPDIRTRFVELLDACLQSQWLLCDSDGGVIWLVMTNELSNSAVDAAAELVAAFDDRHIPILNTIAREVDAISPKAVPFMEIPDTHSFQPWRVVWVSAAPDRLDELALAVGLFVRSQLENSLRREGHAADPWLEQDEEGRAVVSDAVRDLCVALSEHATSIGPPFVTRDYDILVEPLPPVQWHRYGERRVRLAVARREADERFDLGVVGSGLAVWAGFAIEEAMREVKREMDDELRLQLQELAGKHPEEQKFDPERPPRVEPNIGSPLTLYILDEPERHLHPKAQEQAATWLARRAGSHTSLLMATHALPFLSLPMEEVEYSLVSRTRDRQTRTDSITGDVWGALDARASEIGLGSRAQLIQLARAFLIVEGAHDEAVVRHFFRQQLEQYRIVVLPARGAKKVRSLIEAELLALVDVPMIILFDDIRARSVVSEEAPSRRDVAAYALWEMLQHWPPERRQPQVVDFALPDIYCALPDECVRQTVKAKGGTFPGWTPILDAFDDESGGVGFKDFFVNRSGLPKGTDTTELLAQILEHCRLQPRDELVRAMDEVVARVRGALAGPEDA